MPFTFPFVSTSLRDFIAAIEPFGIAGFSVTIPHKERILRYLDDCDPLAAEIGAVNTVVVRAGKLCGYNTDFVGVLRAIEKRLPLASSRVLLLGAGGSARAAAFALARAGAAVSICARRPQRARALAKAVGGEAIDRRALRRQSFDAIVNCTPVGMHPHGGSPLESGELNCRLVMDLIYRPLKTELLRRAESRGIAIISGVDMFLAQGIAQWRVVDGRTRTSVRHAPSGCRRVAEGRAILPQMIEPDFQSFARLARQGNLVPVYETFTADLLTPVGAYLRLARHARYACLLESVEGGEKIARYTFVGANPAEVFRYVNGACVLESESRVSWVQSNPLDFLRNRIQRYRPVRVPGLPPLVAGAIGYFAYDMVRLFERIPDRSQNDLGTEDAVMMFYLGLVVFDHVRHRVWVVRNVFTEGPGSLRSKYRAAVREIAETRRRLETPLEDGARKPARRAAPLRVESNFKRSQFLAAVRKSKEYIRAGDVFQVVVSQRFSARTDANPFDIYRALRVLNPSPYMYFLKLGDTAIVGSSPELLAQSSGPRSFLPAHRRNPPARQGRSRGSALSCRARRRSQGARRTHHAGRSRPQRSRPRL